MIVVRSRVTVILPEILLGRRTSPWRRRRRTKCRWRNPHGRNETGTIEKKHNRKEANNMVNTQHITRHDAQPSMMHDKPIWSYSWQEMMHTRATHQDKFKWGREQHITIPVSPHMQISKLVLIWITHYVEVVKQQVKVHQDDLHGFLVKLHIKFI